MAADVTQYLLPEGIGLDAAVDLLATRLDLRVGRAESTERTFYDTFDGRLHAAGWSLIGQGGRLVATTGPGYRELAAAPAVRARRLYVADLPPGALRDLLGPIVEVRALGVIARTRGRQRALRVCNGDAKTVVRLLLETARTRAGAGGIEVGVRSRLHVVGVRGYDRALARVRRILGEGLGLSAAAVTLVDEAVIAGGGVPGGVSTKLDLRLSGGGSAAIGAGVAMAAMLRTIEQTMPGVLADVDPEFLHDLRVAVRRTRSIQRQLAAALPPERLGHLRAELRWLGQVTGPTRDLDVLLIDFDRLRAGLAPERAAELGPMRDLLRRRRELERRRMARALGSDRTRTLLAEWGAFLDALGAGDGGVGRRLGELAGERIRAVYRQMRRAGLAIDAGTPAERLHDLRKQGKELRYLLEVFAGLYRTAAVRPTVSALKALQETLGQFQDREVQAATLRSLGAELAAADGGPAALIGLGAVLERVEGESVAARAEFAVRFAAFAAAEQRALVGEAFR